MYKVKKASDNIYNYAVLIDQRLLWTQKQNASKFNYTEATMIVKFIPYKCTIEKETGKD